jgi:RND family efflux transporter MFP subunit
MVNSPLRLLLAASTFLGITAWLGGCGDAGAAPSRSGAVQPQAVEVVLAPVQVRTVPRAIEVTGTLFGEEEALISSKLSGRVATISHDVGDAVPRGGILATIEPRDYELALGERRAALTAALAKVGLTEIPPETFDSSRLPTVLRARAEAANADARLQRARRLFEQTPPLLSAQDFADIETSSEVAARNAEVELLNARAALAAARTEAAAVAVAEQGLADTTVRAPGIEGEPGPTFRVAEREVSQGEYVAEGRAMFRLVATDLIKFRADVPERFAAQVKVGQPAQVWVEGATVPARGAVARVSPRIDPQSRMFGIEIHIPNPEGTLKPGAFARGSVEVSIEEGVRFVPDAAVVTFAGVHKVFSVKDSKAVEHRVRLGVRDNGSVEIVGPFPAETVVVTGAGALAQGVPVRVKSP